jgi:hypothetical protein
MQIHAYPQSTCLLLLFLSRVDVDEKLELLIKFNNSRYYLF